MKASIIDNASSDMLTALSGGIERSSEIKMAVAFVSSSGLRKLQPTIESAIERGATFEFLIGLDLLTSEPKAVQHLFDMSVQHDNLYLYCFASTQLASVYHPKLYLLRQDREATSIIGSSNLTEGGLSRNAEVNVVLTGSVDEEAISGAYASYRELKFHTDRVIPDQEFLNLYADLCSREKERAYKAQSDEFLKNLLRAYQDKARQLRRPTPTRRDLVGGWLELIYDTLPEGEFTNTEAYANEGLYRGRFPSNKNIRAKIRQQLQYLEKMQLVAHVAPGRWRKL